MEKTIYKSKWKNYAIEMDNYVCCFWIFVQYDDCARPYLNEIFIARLIFGSCCLSMIISILFFIREIHISTNALKLHMADMDVDVN